MLYYKSLIIAIPLIAHLWYLGGQKTTWARDLIIPILLGVIVGIKTHNLWAVIFSAGSFQIIRIGYGNWDPETDPKPSLLAKITKDRTGAIIRTITGALYGLVGLLPYLVITHNWIIYLGYSVICALVGFVVVKTKQNVKITDYSIGAAVSMVIFI